MAYGTTGRFLRVDLSAGTAAAEPLSDSVLQDYLGGTTLGAKFLYDEVAPSVNWSDPENKIYVGSGPLGGVRIPGSGTVSVIARGAFNNGIASTQANGSFGAFLKYSGFDGILIEGRGADWQYLYVHDGIAELRDSRKFLGLQTHELEKTLKEELGLGDRNVSVLGIGPAGENLVKFAGLHTDGYHSASHNGVGAVWGAKRLKAIAVSRSLGKLDVANPERISELSKHMIDIFKQSPIFEWGTSKGFVGAWKLGDLPIKNYTTNVFPEAANFDAVRLREIFHARPHPCLYCPSHHINSMTVTEGPFAGFEGKEPEYEQWAAFGSQIGNPDPAAAIVLANEVDHLGMDCNETGWIVGWVMECIDKGVLSTKDVDGLDLSWGNVEAVRELVKNVAARRGFGNILAEGVMRAAEQVGGTASDLWVGTHKPNTPRTHDHRGRWVEMLDSCVTNSGTLETQPGFITDLTVYDMPATFDRFNWQEVSAVEAKTKGTLPVVDSLVICAFSSRTNLPLLAEILSAATGWDFSFQRLFAVGRRSVNLQRAYNIRLGHTPQDEIPSSKYCSTPIDGPAAGISIRAHLRDMKDNYYEIMGWDPVTGKPKDHTLRSLGLEHLIDDLR